jgi:uroporphyrinogen-III synthase
VATTWLITREADDARSEREARGERSIVVPCVETKILPWPYLPPPAQRGEGRGEGLTFFTSRRAVASWLASRAPLGEVASLSPATTDALKQSGITPAITSDGGVVSLAEAVVRVSRATRIRYPTSDAGLRSPEQAEALRLLEKLGEVDRRVAYEVAAPAGLREALQAATRDDWSVSFASPSAVHHFFASNAVISRAPRDVACLGASTERAWNLARPEGWPPAVNSRASSPTTKVAS